VLEHNDRYIQLPRDKCIFDKWWVIVAVHQQRAGSKLLDLSAGLP
jgi:hypothetical protein